MANRYAGRKTEKTHGPVLRRIPKATKMLLDAEKTAVVNLLVTKL